MPDALPPVFGPALAALDQWLRTARIPGIVIGGLPFEAEAIEQGVDLAVGGQRLRVARVEDLIVMKAIAHRSRDRADIEDLLAANPHVDLTRCRRVVGEFAAASSMPELLPDFERVIESAHRDPGATDE